MTQPLTVDQLTAGLRRNPYDFLKPSVAAKGAGIYHDLFVVPGLPVAGSAPLIAGAQCSINTLGALPIGAVPPGKEAWLAALSGSSQNASGIILYDRLTHWGGLNATLTTAQALGANVLPRYTSGIGVSMWLEFYALTGSTSVNATINYTNELGAAKTTIVAIPATTVAGQMVPVFLASGDAGILLPTSVQLSATTGTAGNFGITLLRRIAKAGGLAAENKDKDWLSLGLPQILNGACLSLMEICSTTTTGLVDYSLSISDV